jgi:hypothetical protein
MRLNNVNVGSNKLWYLVFALIALAIVFSPLCVAINDHYHQPYYVTCQKFSLHIPLLWSSNKVDFSNVCTNGVSIVKSAPTAFGSEDFGSMLIVTPVDSHDPGSIETLRNIFDIQHKHAQSVPFKLNDEFDNCSLLSEEFRRREIVSVFCGNEAKGIVLNFSGSRHALRELSTIVRLK